MPTEQQYLDKCLQAVLAGTSFAEARQVQVDAGGPKSHSAYERHGFRFLMLVQAVHGKAAIATGRGAGRDWAPIKHKGTDTPENLAATGRIVGKWREKGYAWGPIAERMALPESRARKAYAMGTNVRSQGQRVGHGGRFYTGESGAVLYEGDARATGTQISTEQTLEDAKAAARAKARKAASKAKS